MTFPLGSLQSDGPATPRQAGRSEASGASRVGSRLSRNALPEPVDVPLAPEHTLRFQMALLFGGVAWYLADESEYLPVLVLAVLALSMIITYERARAESLGFSARGGLMERAERLVLLAIGLLFDILVPMMWIMLALTAVTAVHRFVKVWRQATRA